MFRKFIKGGAGIFKRSKKKGPQVRTGYRRGGVGAYTGEGSPIAWKALDHEYRNLGNDHILRDVAKFLKVKPESWPEVRAKFQAKYGNRDGIWLTKTVEQADRYAKYGDLQTYRYHKDNVICNLGPDGIFVLLGPGPTSNPSPDCPPDSVGGTNAGESDAEVLSDELVGSIPEEDPPTAKVRRARSGKPKRGYMFYPAGLGATKEDYKNPE